jgi:hypothetical protein
MVRRGLFPGRFDVRQLLLRTLRRDGFTPGQLF